MNPRKFLYLLFTAAEVGRQLSFIFLTFVHPCGLP